MSEPKLWVNGLGLQRAQHYFPRVGGRARGKVTIGSSPEHPSHRAVTGSVHYPGELAGDKQKSQYPSWSVRARVVVSAASVQKRKVLPTHRVKL